MVLLSIIYPYFCIFNESWLLGCENCSILSHLFCNTRYSGKVLL